MVKLENDKFLSELTKLFQCAETSGNVVVTMKTYDGRTKPEPRKSAAGNKRHQQQSAARRRTTSAADHHTEAADEHTCLIRATKGSKKISTIVPHKEINRFQMAYANLLRGNMTSLIKKKGRSKGEATKQQRTQ